jgi:curved DNA-binding protein CbpA
MDFQIAQGLATYDYVDHYAILGVPLTADAGEIRRRYLHIVRSLHPDSRAEANKELASQFLSKLVNPSYKVLSQERERTEYLVLLRLLGQRLVQERARVELQTPGAQQLLQIPGLLDNSYRQAVQEVALSQYESLEQTLALTGQLSELNLVYLQRQEVAVPPVVPVQSAPRAEPPTAAAGEVAPLDTAALYASQYHRRAQELIAKNNFQAAMVELRDALKLDPDNSQCHSLLGTLYLKLNQLTMARVHFNQALKFNPRNAAALDGKQQVEKLERQSKSSQSRGAQKPSGGLFGLFGSRKK